MLQSMGSTESDMTEKLKNVFGFCSQKVTPVTVCKDTFTGQWTDSGESCEIAHQKMRFPHGNILQEVSGKELDRVIAP